MGWGIPLLAIIEIISLAHAIVILPAFTDLQLIQVQNNLYESATHSWELGTMTQALMEYYWRPLSVYGTGPIPPQPNSTFVNSDVAGIVSRVVSSRLQDQVTFFNDPAVGDSASIGVADMVLNWTMGTSTATSSYSTAATIQLSYLLNGAPRAASGAISQRSDEVQLWADFIYMAPPFIAYYGAVFSDQYLLYESYNQIMLYRAALRDDSGLWRHITMGNVVVQDTGHWATGNAWVVAGTLRVLQTIRRSTLASQFQGQQADLAGLAREIITATWNHQQSNGALLNYIDDTTSFADMSSTALMAASTFRLAYLTSDRANLSLADARLLAAARKARSLIIQSLDGDGWLTSVVDPQDWHQQGSHSPEGQAFVLLLEASYQDWMAAIPT